MNYDRGQVLESSGEQYTLQYVCSKIDGPITIFDVGANKGQYATMVLKNARKPFKLYSFEPQQSAFAVLKDIKADNFQPINIGFGAEKKQAIIYNQIEGSVFASVVETSHQHVAPELVLKETINLSTIDSFCEENRIAKIDFLKIDVEGYEMEVLKGAQSMLAGRRISYIQFEFGVASIEARIYMKDFFKLLKDFDIYRLLPRGFVKMDQYNEYLELFMTANYLAVSKSL